METFNPTTQDLEFAISTILRKFDNPEREGLKDTPKRYIKALTELLTPIEPNITLFDSNGYNELIIEKDIKYYSLCEHHILPFFGTITIAYIPNDSIIGLSKLSRIVEYWSKRLNTQEYLTDNIADYLMEKLNPKGIAVIANGRHMCKEMRGIKKEGTMITMAYRGILANPDKQLELRQRL